MLAASKWARIRRSPGSCYLTNTTVFRVWYLGSLQMDKTRRSPGKCYLTYVAVLRVWYAGSLQRDDVQEVSGNVLSYLCHCPMGLAGKLAASEKDKKAIRGTTIFLTYTTCHGSGS
jgi:hypothetical protein